MSTQTRPAEGVGKAPSAGRTTGKGDRRGVSAPSTGPAEGRWSGSHERSPTPRDLAETGAGLLTTFDSTSEGGYRR